jgi:hypothetical protein
MVWVISLCRERQSAFHSHPSPFHDLFWSLCTNRASEIRLELNWRNDGVAVGAFPPTAPAQMLFAERRIYVAR